jgi:putative transposase
LKEKRAIVGFAVARGLSERRVVSLIGLARSSARYKAKPSEDTELLARLHELKGKYPRFGVPRILALLNAEGRTVNHKRVERLWRVAGLQVPRRRRRPFKKSKIEVQPTVPCAAEYPNHHPEGTRDL